MTATKKNRGGRSPVPMTPSWLMGKVDTEGPDGCWLWTGARFVTGYGKARGRYAHRVAYELLVGPIPDGHDVHHRCHVKLCVNPDHVEPLTRSDHRAAHRPARSAECPHGHPWDEANTGVSQDGRRRWCRACARERMGRRVA